MASAAAARRYARALFGLAQEEGRVEAVRGELTTLGELLDGHRDLRATLFRPLHPAAERKAALAALAEQLGVGGILQLFLQFLIDQRRLIEFPAIRSEYDRLADEAAGRMRAEVISASPLPEAQLDRLRQALSRQSGRQVAVELTLDPSLLGGVVAKVGDLVFDGSLRTQLRQLRASLTKEG
ncbi:MAG: ATP synthase F1 subunit delta [Myxococcota bacterium]